MQASFTDESTSKFKVILLLILSVSMVSSASILITISVSPSLVKVFWRTLYGSLFMAIIGVFRGDFKALRKPEVRRNWLWLVAIGIVLSLHFSTWFQSLELTSIPASVVLVDSSPIFTAILSTLFLGEALRKRSWIGIAIAIIGAILLVWIDYGLELGALTGDLLALAGAVFLALYFIGGRKYAKDMPNVLVFEPSEVLIFLALAIFPTVLGHSVNNYLLTKVPAYVVSTAVLGEPIGATILAALLLNQVIESSEFVGFSIILFGVAIVLADIVSKERFQTLPLNNSNRT
jgi:drug/metabolite transporter (DMT)-like permease